MTVCARCHEPRPLANLREHEGALWCPACRATADEWAISHPVRAR